MKKESCHCEEVGRSNEMELSSPHHAECVGGVEGKNVREKRQRQESAPTLE
jgi:hypothetical protein